MLVFLVLLAPGLLAFQAKNQVDSSLAHVIRRYFAPEHREDVIRLFECLANTPVNITLRNVMDTLPQPKPKTISFIYLISDARLRAEKYAEARECFDKSENKFIIALGQLTIEMVNVGHKEDFVRAMIENLLEQVKDHCNRTIQNTCKEDFIRGEGRSEVQRIEKDFRFTKLVSAISFVGLELTREGLCDFGLKGKLNPKLFTNDFGADDLVVVECDSTEYLKQKFGDDLEGTPTEDDWKLVTYVSHYPSAHRQGVRKLIQCFFNRSTEKTLDEFARRSEDPHDPVFYKYPVVYHLLEAAIYATEKGPSAAACFLGSKDKHVVALGNVAKALILHDRQWPEKRLDLAGVLFTYNETCRHNPKFKLPCLKDLEFLPENGFRDHRSEAVAHHRAVELTGALSYLGAELGGKGFCKFDLEGRLDPSVFTNDFYHDDPVISGCDAEDYTAIVSLAQGAFL
ncbi:unnamed protein product [Bursaphelenchus xylophilus]|uniref:(pine wood nematode) hypothetical protein n=1 Tax=Bursaphelenchus xylophilus TaxID=6326 RepID=A0A1I7S6V2_BURXY|nr:unnamed protein product [Bursaphelenchus xylophilus]CAG9079731.1 unnamed protein product [Bursaphelenchus xylophilus]